MLPWLKELFGTKTKLLVVVAGTYVLGYITWLVHAFMHGLGMLPILEAQYLLAGLIPMIIAIFAYITVKGYMRYRPRYIAWIESIRPLYRKTIAYVYYPSSGLVVFVYVASFYMYALNLLSVIAFYVLNIIGPIFLILLLLLRPKKGMKIQIQDEWGFHRKLRANAYNWIQNSRLYIFAVLFGIVAIFFYFNVLWLNIPHEFGGVRPRHAYLDIVLDQASTETLQGIISINATSANNTVVRSNMVDVYFCGSDVIIVKHHGQQGRNTPTYEIKQSIVKAVTWGSSDSIAEETTTSQ